MIAHRRARVVPATQDHIDAIARNPRQGDVEELAARGTSFREALQHGLARSHQMFVGLYDERPVAAFGVVPYSLMSGTGVVWMLGSQELERKAVQKEFVRYSRPALEFLQDHYPEMLFNCVDARNATAIRWLQWLGFTFVDPIPLGNKGEFFYPFWRRAQHV